MPTLVLDLESSSMCCYLALVERLLDQWGIVKHFPQSRYVSLSLIGLEKLAEFFHNIDRYLVWLNWLIFIIIISLFGKNWWCPCNETAWSLYPKKAFANSRPKCRHQWKLVGDIFSSRVIASKTSSRNYSIPCEFFPGAKLCVWCCIALGILGLNSSQAPAGRINWREREFSLWIFGHLK